MVQLVKKFDEFLLYNQAADFEIGSASNSNSTSPYIKPRELLLSHRVHRSSPMSTSCVASATPMQPTWMRSSHTGPARRSSPSIPRTPASSPTTAQIPPTSLTSGQIESEFELNTIEEPLSGIAAGLVMTSTPTGKFVYWPDHKPADLTDGNLHCVAYLETLPFQEGTPLIQTQRSTRQPR
jgi:hypothetical protein